MHYRRIAVVETFNIKKKTNTQKSCRIRKTRKEDLNGINFFYYRKILLYLRYVNDMLHMFRIFHCEWLKKNMIA